MIFSNQNCWLGVCVLAMSLLTGCSFSGNQTGFSTGEKEPIRVACVGDSITYGYGLADREANSYPAQLQKLLGEKWEVENFGFNGATVLKRGTKPYTLLPEYRRALSYRPKVVILKLGTNDTNAKSWPTHKDEFVSDYREIIQAFRRLDTQPRIYLCLPVPLFRDRGKAYDTDSILVQEIIPKIREIAREERIPIIDLYTAFEEKAAQFPDGVHPDLTGATTLATTVHRELVAAQKQQTRSLHR